MEQLKPKPGHNERVAPSAPQAGPFAEAAAFVRLAVAEGRMTAEEGLRLTEQAYRDTMLAQLAGYPVETDSFQLPETERK